MNEVVLDASAIAMVVSLKEGGETWNFGIVAKSAKRAGLLSRLQCGRRSG